MSNTTKSQVNHNFQIPRKMKIEQKKCVKWVVLGFGVWGLFGSIGIYLVWDFLNEIKWV